MKKLTINGKQTIIKDDAFIASGGEANIYKLSQNEVGKIYHDQSKIIPIAKIQELQTLTLSKVIKPNAIIYDSNIPVGFTMKDISGISQPICRLFNTTYWKTNHLNEKIIIRIIEDFIKTMDFIHSKNCLVVDFGDLNFCHDIVNFENVYFIDTNAYQTPSFPANAITPYYTDFTIKKNKWTVESDSYSAGIIIFQIFTGLHPFQGNHPDFSQLKNPDRTLERMKRNISVYDRKVSVNNSAVRDFSIIPSNYTTWLEGMFKYGKRLLPPGCAGITNFVQIKQNALSGNNFEIRLLKTLESNILSCSKEFFMMENRMIHDFETDKECALAHYKKINLFKNQKREVLQINKNLTNSSLIITNTSTGKEVELDLNITDFLIVENQIYVTQRENLYQLLVDDYDGRMKILIKNSWNIMPHSSIVYDGMIYQNILGKCFFTIPVPAKNWMIIKRIKEMDSDNRKIIDIKREKNIVFVLYRLNNETKRCIIKFDDDYDSYKIFDDVEHDDINFTVLETGVVVSLENKKIKIFSSRFDDDKMKEIEDESLSADMRLSSLNNKVVFYEENKIYSIKMT